MLLHWWHCAGLGDVPLLLMLSRGHPNRRLLWPLEKGVWAGVGEGKMLGRWMLYPAHCWPCHPATLGYSPIAEPLGWGALSEAAVHLPGSCPHRCGAASEHGLLLVRGQAPAPLHWAAPPAGLIAVQGVLRSLPRRCCSLESLLIPGHPAWPCGQVVITCGASHASSPGIAPQCPVSHVGQPGQHSPGCQLSARAAPRTSGIMFILEMGNQRKTSHRRPGLTSQWGQEVGCSAVQLGDVLGQWGKEGGESDWYPGLVPHPALSGDTSLSLAASGAIRWPVAGTADSAPC